MIKRSQFTGAVFVITYFAEHFLYLPAIVLNKLDKGLLRSKTQFWQLNDELLTEFSKFNWSRFKAVHLFLPIVEKREVDTYEFIHFFKISFPKLVLVVSRSNHKTGEMSSVIFDPETTVLVKNKYNIPEPIYGEKIHSVQIDAVIVPLLTFDKNGHRVGYGAGFYDRFLAKCRADVVKIGVSVFEPMEEMIDTNEQDVPLNYCITPVKTHVFA